MAVLLISIIYLAFISLGLPDSLLGSGWPVMHQSMGVPVSFMGIVSMIISGGTIVSSLLSERFIKRFGTPAVTVVSVLMTAAALMGFSLSDSFIMLCLWGLPYGLGAGSIDAALNNYVALHYNSRHMSWLHCFWGVGTIISPYIMSHALAASVWNDGYRTVSFIQLGIAAVLIITLPVWKIHSSGGGEEENSKTVGIRGALKIKGVPFLLTGFFAYCAGEATVMLWASSYLVRVRAYDEETAAAFGALFFIGITAGRFISGIISEKLGDKRLIYCGTAIALTGCIMVMLPINDLALAGLVIIGLGCAPVYPAIIHSTPSNFGAENSQAIIGIQMASAYIGSTFMPPVFGAIGNSVGLGFFPVYVMAFFVLMIIMVGRTFRCVNGETQ